MATTLTTWRPFSELAELRQRFDRLFEETENGGRAWAPSIDLVRSEGELVLKVDLPGITSEDVEIEVSDGVLTVSGEHSEEHGAEGERYMRRERRTGSFKRSMALPEGIDADQIEATCRDGLLEVRIPLPEVEGEAGEKVTIKPKAA